MYGGKMHIAVSMATKRAMLPMKNRRKTTVRPTSLARDLLRYDFGVSVAAGHTTEQHNSA